LVKAVFFDAVGTLFHLRGSVGSHYAAVADSFGCKCDATAMDASFRQAWKVMLAPRGHAVPRTADDRLWWRSLVDLVLDECLRPEQVLDREAYFEMLYTHFAGPGVWELFPETAEVLQQLHNRVAIGVISNFDTRLHTILEQFGIRSLFQAVVISSEVGVDKPDPQIFAEALRQLGVTAGEALHIGDDPEADWSGAAGAGLQVYPLKRPSGSLRDLLPLVV
jgi:putative hydrolase of the HAD superfamily